MSTTKIAKLLTEQDQQLINTMSALGDKTRYKIFKLLLQNDDLCVSEIAARLDVSTSAISQQFRTLELIGLVDKVRFGQKICYRLRINSPLVKHLVSSIN